MKKGLVIILTFLCLGCLGQTVSAFGPPPPYYHHGPHQRWEADRVLEETRGYVMRANQIASSWERGRLESAFANQRQARTYYRRGLYGATIRYSLRARKIAQDIIANHQRRHGPPPPRHHRDHGSSINIHLRI